MLQAWAAAPRARTGLSRPPGGAPAPAADPLEELRLAPVHVHLRLPRQRADPLELLQRRLEALRADALDVRLEALAGRRALALVDVEDAVDRQVRLLRRYPRHARRETAAIVAGAADQDVVARAPHP